MYHDKEYYPTTFRDAIRRQAKAILNDVKPAVFVSGGIDSQTMAWAFNTFVHDVDYVYIRSSYCGQYNELEYFFVSQFCKRHHINLQIIDLEFDKSSLRDFLLESDYFNTPVGSGTVFRLEGIRRYEGDGVPVIAVSNFAFVNDGSLCKGIFRKPGTGLSYGIPLNEQIIFDQHSNYIFQCYEHYHKIIPELQYLKRIESKNIIYTNMGFPFRPKMSGWEFLDEKNDYSTLSTIDWSNDHGKNARFVRGIEVIVDVLDLPKEYIGMKLEHQKDDSDNFVTLYEFEP